MAVQEDVIRLKMEALGAEGLDRMEAKAKLLEGSLEQLGQQLKAGAISEDDFEEHAREMIKSLESVAAHVHVGRDLAEAMKTAAKAAANSAHEVLGFADVYDVMATSVKRTTVAEQEAAASARAMGSALSDLGQYASRASVNIEKVNGVIPRITKRMQDAKSGSSGLSSTLTQLSYAADDAQYGMRGLSNNIAPLLTQFGVWGSVIAIGAVGIYQMTQHWNALTGSFRTDLIDQTAGSIDKLTKRMEELKKETKLTSKQMEEMNNLRIEIEGDKAAKKDAGTPTERQGQVKAAYQEALSQDHGYASVANAAQSAVAKPFLDRPEEAIQQAAGQGMLKNEKGDAIKLDKNLWMNSKSYMDMLKRQYMDTVIPVLQADLLKRIGTDGDEQALDELKRGMEASNTYAVDDEGNVNDIKGKDIKPLSTLMRGAPTVRKKRDQKETDKEAVVALQDESEAAFQARVAQIAGELKDRVGDAIANGKKGADLDKFIADILAVAYPKNQFGGRSGPGVWTKAIGDKVRENINADVSGMIKGQNIRPEDAKGVVAKNLNTNANAFNTNTAENLRKGLQENDEKRDTEKDAQKKALDSGIGDGLSKDIMMGLFANRQMAIPGKATAKQKAQQAEDLARFKARIVQEARRELIQGGMDPGKAEQLAGQAPQHFIDQYNAWHQRQTAPGGGGVADPQRRRHPGQREKRDGFHSVGVGPEGDPAIDLNKQAFNATAKTAEVVGKMGGQVGQLSAAWPRLAQQLAQLDRQAESWDQFTRSASMIERG